MEQNTDLNRQKLLQFVEEAVSCEEKDDARILSYLRECDQLGIKVLPLDINKSEAVCTIEDEHTFRIGFSALVPGGRAQFLEDILADRQENGQFQTFQEFCERIDLDLLPENFLLRCIEAGAFDSTGTSRARLLLGYENIVQVVQKSKADRSVNQISLFDALPASSKVQLAPMPLPEAESLTDEETIEHEKNALGFSFTKYLLQREEENTGEGDLNGAEGEQSFVSEEMLLETEDEVPPESISDEPELVPSAFIIQLQTRNTTESTLLQLRERMIQSSGDVNVMLEFIDEQQNKTSVRTHTNYAVSLSEEFVKDIEAITGKKTTRVLNEEQ